MCRNLPIVGSAVLLIALALGCGRQASSKVSVIEKSTDPSKAGTQRTRPQEDQQVDGDSHELLRIATPDAKQPVTAGAVLQPAHARPGEAMVFVVQVTIAPGWHIYAVDGPAGTEQPTTLKLKLPEGLEPDGPWNYPEAVAGQDGVSRVYQGVITFRRRLRIADKAASAKIQVTCELGYQACDPFSCRPPATLTLTTTALLYQT